MINQAVGFVFPGQGSQKVGMLYEQSAVSQIIKDTFDDASEVLGYDLWDLSQNGEQEALNLTETTQPLLLTAGVALWRLWEDKNGAQPALMAGHSLGEFTALVCAGAMAFEDGVGLVQKRGQFMQQAVPLGVGAMAAIIGLEDDQISAACLESSLDQCVVAVNYNSPGQVVIAGHAEAVDRAMQACKDRGAKRAMPLAVSAPFHTPLMRPAGEQLGLELAKISINSPNVPVVHNVHAQFEAEPEKIKQLLVDQISSPVQWTQCVQQMRSSGVDVTIECGPGNVLSGLSRRIDKSIQSYGLEQPQKMIDAIEALEI